MTVGEEVYRHLVMQRQTVSSLVRLTGFFPSVVEEALDVLRVNGLAVNDGDNWTAKALVCPSGR